MAIYATAGSLLLGAAYFITRRIQAFRAEAALRLDAAQMIRERALELRARDEANRVLAVTVNRSKSLQRMALEVVAKMPPDRLADLGYQFLTPNLKIAVRVIQDTAAYLARAQNDAGYKFICDHTFLGTTPAEYALIRAAHDGRLDIVTELINFHQANVNAEDQFQKTALHYAAEEGHSDVVEGLLALDSNIDAGDPFGWTALKFAEKNENGDVVRILSQAGAMSGYAEKKPIYL